ncbi:MAG: acyltransferase family protein [Pseudomonadota bacterium]
MWLSGYLIIGLISQQTDANKFSLLEFYIRRARRLVPAIIPVLIFSLVLAFFTLTNTGFQDFFKTLVGAGFFSSNYVFLAESGYFEREAKYEILLHTWSLAVEWQFYLLIPFAILIAGPLFRFWLVLAISALSFSLSVYLIELDKEAQAFYSVFPRLWELGVGGLLAMSGAKLSENKGVIATVRLLGLAAVTLAVFSYHENMPFPGTSALLPVCGTLLLIIPAKENFVSATLASAPMVWLGQLSYSLYLWHWPLIVLIHLYIPSPNEGFFAGALGLSLLFAVLNYSFVENPVRRRTLLQTHRSFSTAIGVAAIMVIGLFAVVQSPPFKEIQTTARLTKFRAFGEFAEKLEIEKVEYHAKVNQNFNGESGPFDAIRFEGYTCSYDLANSIDRIIECLQGLSRTNTVLIAGDSHGRDFLHAMKFAYPEKHFIMLHQSSCAPIDYEKKPANRDCFPSFGEILAKTREITGIRKILLSARWDAAEPGLVASSLKVIADLGMKSLIIGPKPVLKSNVGKLVRNMAWQGITISQDTVLSPNLFKDDIAKLEGGFSGYGKSFVPVSQLVCSGKGCPLMIEHGHPLYFDREHFTIPGIEYFGNGLKNMQQIQSFLDQ